MPHTRVVAALVACVVLSSAPVRAQGSVDSISVWTRMLATGTADDRAVAVARLGEAATLPPETENAIIAEMHRVNDKLLHVSEPWDEAMSEYWMALAILTSRIPRRDARLELIPAIGISTGMGRRVATLGDDALPGLLRVIASGVDVPPALNALGYVWFWADSTGSALTDVTRASIVHAWMDAVVAGDTAYHLRLGVQDGIEAAGDPALVPLLNIILNMPSVSDDPVLFERTWRARERLAARARGLPLPNLLGTVERATRALCRADVPAARKIYCDQLRATFGGLAKHVDAAQAKPARDDLDALVDITERARMWETITEYERQFVIDDIDLIGARIPTPQVPPAEADRTRQLRECSRAEQFVRESARASRSERIGALREQRSLAYATLVWCGRAGDVAAETIRSLRTELDTAVLRVEVGGFGDVRDSAIFAAAMDVAADRNASANARVFALKTLWVLKTGKYWLPIKDFMTPEPETEPAYAWALCGRGTYVSDAVPFWHGGRALATDYVLRINTLAKRLHGDRTEPMAVRLAASCVLR